VGLLLLISAGVIATCGLIYELLASTLASYLLGDSITQFSTVIGTYLFAMGIGSWLSRYIKDKDLLLVFVRVELLIGLVGGFSAAILFLIFAHVDHFRIALYSLVLIIGTLVGLEIPLLLRILKERLEFKDLVSKVFTFDYLGALLASLLFPLVLVPYLGLVRSGLFFGIANAAIALVLVLKLREPQWVRPMRVASVVTIAILSGGFVLADRLVEASESTTYVGKVIYAKQTPYQRIVLTTQQDDIRLFLNGNLQFSSRDEYRYHEALVHPLLSRLNQPKKILVLGGGDGLAVREILKYPSVEHVTLVDLDPEMTDLFSHSESLTHLNSASLLSSKVELVHADAFVWLRENQQQFDAVIVDFPDPSNFSLGKLYSLTFYRALSNALSDSGAAVIQSTSPYFARRSFWCIERTLAASGLITEPYHAMVPSFGEWGYVLASKQVLGKQAQLPQGLRFIDEQALTVLFNFPPDMDREPAEVNRLDNQALVRYFDEEWSRYIAS
jgi:spermidine synthase